MKRFAATIAAGLVALAGCGGETFRVPSEAMTPTLKLGAVVETNPDKSPKRGDIIVFHPPAGADVLGSGNPCGAQQPADEVCPAPTPAQSKDKFIKRIVAVGGDTVQIRNNRVILNEQPLPEPYIASDTSCQLDGSLCNLPRPYKVPQGYVFTLGDNRGASADSRVWGPVPIGWIIGKVTHVSQRGA